MIAARVAARPRVAPERALARVAPAARPAGPAARGADPPGAHVSHGRAGRARRTADRAAGTAGLARPGRPARERRAAAAPGTARLAGGATRHAGRRPGIARERRRARHRRRAARRAGAAAHGGRHACAQLAEVAGRARRAARARGAHARARLARRPAGARRRAAAARIERVPCVERDRPRVDVLDARVRAQCGRRAQRRAIERAASERGREPERHRGEGDVRARRLPRRDGPGNDEASAHAPYRTAMRAAAKRTGRDIRGREKGRGVRSSATQPGAEQVAGALPEETREWAPLHPTRRAPRVPRAQGAPPPSCSAAR